MANIKTVTVSKFLTSRGSISHIFDPKYLTNLSNNVLYLQALEKKFVDSLNFVILCQAEIVQHKDITRAFRTDTKWTIIIIDETETPFVLIAYHFIYYSFFTVNHTRIVKYTN